MYIQINKPAENVMRIIRDHKMSSLLALVTLALGLVVTLSLAGRQQNIRSKADVANGGLQATDQSNNPLPYEGNGVYKTHTLNVKIKLKDINLLQ